MVNKIINQHHDSHKIFSKIEIVKIVDKIQEKSAPYFKIFTNIVSTNNHNHCL